MVLASREQVSSVDARSKRQYTLDDGLNSEVQQCPLAHERRHPLSYDLCIWDPSRHEPLPTSRKEGIEIAERLGTTSDMADTRFNEFGDLLVQRCGDDAQAKKDSASVSAFWGSDPRLNVTACRSAVLRLSIPTDDCIRQISHAVDAAAEVGLVVLDDQTGMCFLPDGTIFPESDREMWKSDLADMRAGPPDPNAKKPDSRTFLEKLGGELIDSIGRGNRHQ